MTRNPDEWFNHRASKWLPHLKRREYYADRTLMLIISLILMSVTAVAEPLPQAKFGVFGLEFKDYFAIGTGSLSVLLSGLALYLTQFRKAKVSAQIGPAIHLYHPQDGGYSHLPANDLPEHSACERRCVQGLFNGRGFGQAAIYPKVAGVREH